MRASETAFYKSQFDMVKQKITLTHRLFRKPIYIIDLSATGLKSPDNPGAGFFTPSLDGQKFQFETYPTNEELWDVVVELFGEPKYEVQMPWELEYVV